MPELKTHTHKQSRWPWCVGIVLAVSIFAGIAVIWNTLPAQARPDDALCLPLPPEPPLWSHHAYLPCVLSSDPPPMPVPPPCAVAEIERNDTHTDAQSIAQCVRGRATTTLDQDWYRLALCRGPITLTLALQGTGFDDLDLYLYGDPPGLPLAAGEGATDTEQFQVPGLISGTYYILVQPGLTLTGPGTYTVTAGARW